MMREKLEEMYDIKSELLKDEPIKASRAKELYKTLKLLHVKFLINQMQLLKSCERRNKYCYPDIFESIHETATDLKICFKKILQTNANSSTAPGQFQWDRISRKQKIFFKIIESLEWNSEPSKDEAKILLGYLRLVNESFLRYHEKKADRHHANSQLFGFTISINPRNSLIAYVNFKRRVISLGNQLKEIIGQDLSIRCISTALTSNSRYDLLTYT